MSATSDPQYVDLVGIDEVTTEASLLLYPNPANDVFMLSIETLRKEKVKTEIVNIVGEIVFSEIEEKGSGKYVREINFMQPAGIYFVKIQVGNKVNNRKLIVKR